MKKRRSTVYVRSGKDVTLYIPSDTPPEVIDYLNQLKMEGIFSQGIMDILTKYIREDQSVTRPVREIFPGESFEPIESAQEEDADVDFNQPKKETPVTNDQKKFSLAQIFRQSRQNSGKLVHTSDHGNKDE